MRQPDPPRGGGVGSLYKGGGFWKRNGESYDRPGEELAHLILLGQ
jgi:hypothetical protein